MTTVKDMNNVSKIMAHKLVRLQSRMLKGMETLTEPMNISTEVTPKDEVLSVDRWKLYRYRPMVKNPYPIPVVIIYALVNRFYMVDIQQDRSMVKKFLEAGLDVYVLDWGHPTRGDKYITMEDYIDDYIDRIVDYVRSFSGQPAITIYGICQGGTLSSIYTALYPEKVKNLAIMVAPINFHTNTGLLNVWSRHLNIDKMVDTFGNIPGHFMNDGFLLLNPLRLIFQKYIDFIDHMDDKDFIANFVRMEKWIFDSPDQVGEAFRKFIKCMYQENQLVKNKFYLGDRKVDLKNITQPVLNVYGEKDNIVPPDCSRVFNEMVGSSDKTEMSFPTGHIGLFTSSRSQKEYAPAIAEWLVNHSQVGSAIKKTTKIKKAVKKSKNN